MKKCDSLDISKFEAVIFDMDGTMVDNMQYHVRAWKEFVALYGVELSEQQLSMIPGRKNSDLLQLLLDRTFTTEEVTQFSKEKEALYRKLYAGNVASVSGLFEVLAYLRQNSIQYAVATSAPKENRELVLRELHLEDTFSVLVGEEDISKGKPDPEVYETCAKRLNVPSEQCLVFEDALAGVQSAKAAGMTVVGVQTAGANTQIEDADYSIDDFTQLTLR